MYIHLYEVTRKDRFLIKMNYCPCMPWFSYLCLSVWSCPFQLSWSPQLGNSGIKLMWQNHGQRHTFFRLVCSISKHQPLGTKNINIRFTICNKFHGNLLKSRHILPKLNIFSDCTSIFHNIQLAKWDLDCANCIMKCFNSPMCLLSCSIFSRHLSTQILF